MKSGRYLIQICVLWAALLPAAMNAQFTFTTNNGAITITGYTGSEGTLVIPEMINGYPVIGIGVNYGGFSPGVFSDANLTNVMIPGSVTNIFGGAFADSSSLTAILVDEQNLFYSSTNGILFDKPLTTLVEVPSGMAGSYTVPDSVTIIGSEAFDDCGSLTNIVIGNNVDNIGSGAFSYCFGLTSISIPNSVTNIPSEAFFDCGNVTNITIGTNVNNIADEAFAFCYNLTGFTIPNSVTNIGSEAFDYCNSLTNITIGTNVTSIGSGAFAECSSLTAISVDEQNLFYSSADGILFDKPQTTLLQAPGAFAGNYTIPDGITTIGSGAFSDCTNLTGITLPKSVTNLADDTFSDCTGLTNVTIPDSITTIGSDTFADCFNLASLVIGTNVTSIGISAFAYCSNLTDVVIPNRVTSIGNEAFFSCGGLTNITIGTNVTSIGSGAFNFCTNLTSITIPNSVTNIGIGSGLSPLPGFPVGLGLSAESSLLAAGCSRLTAITVDDQNLYYSSDEGILFNKSQTTLIEAPGGFTGSCTIPNSVTSVGAAAFLDCANLTSVAVPDSVTNIGYEAFVGCGSLTAIAVDDQNSYYSSTNGILFNKLQTTLIQAPAGGIIGNYTIPNGVTNLGSRSFAFCTDLTSITIPETVAIGDFSFEDCVNLTGIYFKGNAPVIASSSFPLLPIVRFPIIGDYFYSPSNEAVYYLPGTTGWSATFEGLPAYLWVPPYVCTPTNGTITLNGFRGSGGMITIPATINGLPVTSIASGAFNHFGSLTNIIIGTNLASIGSYAFEYCTNLTSITIPGSVTNIGSEAFAFCTNLNSVYFMGNAPGADTSVFLNMLGFIHLPLAFPVVYYLPGTQGWGTTFAGCLTVLWNPQAQTSGISFGVRTNRFGFDITGSSNLVVVVEACTNFADPVWTPVSTNTLNTFIGTNGTSYFSDPQWTNYPDRFYRIRSP